MPEVFRVKVVDFAGQEAWGPQGEEAFHKLAPMVDKLSAPLVNLDLSGVARMDVSYAIELFTNLVRHNAGSRCLFVSSAQSPTILQNIDAAFFRKGMAILHRKPDGDYEILGQPIKEHLLRALEAVESLGRATTREVCGRIKGLSMTACNNRLRELVDSGLVVREDGVAKSGGREYTYSPVTLPEAGAMQTAPHKSVTDSVTDFGRLNRPQEYP